MTDATADTHDAPDPAPGDAHAHADGEAHVVSLSLLFGVFAALIFLTWATVSVTMLDFGYSGNLIVAMVIATVKATLVGLYFMHLRWDKPFHSITIICSLIFVGLFIIFTLFDAGRYQDSIEERSYQEAPAQIPAE